MKYEIIKVPIYGILLRLVIIKNDDEFSEALSEFCDVNDYEVETTLACVCEDTEVFMAIFLRKNCKRKTIIHECFHLTMSMIRYLGISTEHEEESSAYLNDWINRKIYKSWKKLRK